MTLPPYMAPGTRLLPTPVPSVPGAALCLEHVAGQGSGWQGAVTREGPAGTSCPHTLPLTLGSTGAEASWVAFVCHGPWPAG